MQAYFPFFLYWIKEIVLGLLFSSGSTMQIWQKLCYNSRNVSPTCAQEMVVVDAFANFSTCMTFNLTTSDTDYRWSSRMFQEQSVPDAKLINLVQRAQSRDWSQVTRLVAIYTNTCLFSLYIVLEIFFNLHQRYFTRNVDSSKVYPIKLTYISPQIENRQDNPALRLAVANAKTCPFLLGRHTFHAKICPSLLCRHTFHSLCTESKRLCLDCCFCQGPQCRSDKNCATTGKL